MNNFYVNWRNVEKIKEDTTFGVVIDFKGFQDELTYERLDKFLLSLREKDFYDNINSYIIKIEFNEDILNKVKNANIFFIIDNEEDPNIRMRIRDLEDDVKQHIIGKHPCTTGIDILRYRVIGISHIIVGSPLINDSAELSMLDRIGYTLYIVPNVSNGATWLRDPNWIRPEGIHLYPKVHNWILSANDSMDINLILKAYKEEGYIGPIKDFLVNFNNDYNPYKDTLNLFSPPFDYTRTGCSGECLICKECETAGNFVKVFTGEDN